MKVLKVIGIIILIIVGGYSAWMATLPKSYTLERSVEINAPASKVYNTVVDMTTWKDWSYWDLSDSTNKVEYFGETGAVESGYSWKGDLTKEGTFTITNTDAPNSLDFKVSFADMGENTGRFNFNEGEGGVTTVVYSFDAEFGFFDRIGKIFIDNAVGMAYDESLNNLKEMVEAMPEEPAKPEVEISVIENMPVDYYSVTDRISMEELNSEFFATRYAELGEFLGKDAANMNMPPFAIYEEWDMENKMTTIAVAMAVTSNKKGSDRVKKGTTYEGQVMKAVHMGPYEETGTVHLAMDDYAKANNLQIVGAPWEVYVTDPSTEPDNSKWITEIYYPVKAASEDADSETSSEEEVADA